MREQTILAKKAVVAEVEAKFEAAQSIVLVDYRGVTVQEDTELRDKLRAAGVEYKVLKNEVIKRAANNLAIENLDPLLEGPTSVAYSADDAVIPAKILTEFIKDKKKMSIKGGVLEGKAIDVAMVESLAKLPSKEELLAKMLGSLNAPISGLVMTLSGVLSKFVRVLDAVKETKTA